MKLIDYVKNRSMRLIPVVYGKKLNSKNCAREGVNSTKMRERKKAFSEMVFWVVIKGRDLVNSRLVSHIGAMNVGRLIDSLRVVNVKFSTDGRRYRR